MPPGAEDLMIDLDHTIRETRRRRGWSQFDVAARLGTTTATVSRWERGQAWPRYQRLRALAVLLEVPPGALRRPRRDRARPERLTSVADRIARTLGGLAL
jgi:transcriptional regulator with XRE-family HTH domain